MTHGHLDPLERHDRTLRFLQHAVPWAKQPTPEALLDIGQQIRITLRLPSAAGRPQLQLAALAVTNVIGRLPIGMLRFVVHPAVLDLRVPPYRGTTLIESLDDLTSRLQIDADIDARLNDQFEVEIALSGHRFRWSLALQGSAAYLGRRPAPSRDGYDAVGCYTAACMVGGEIIRAWARGAADLGVGIPGERFASRTEEARDTWLDLAPPAGRGHESLAWLPPADWVSCGAVNQAVLAVLAASATTVMSGTIFDPGLLDTPDLNRSLLSFPADVGRPKAQVAAEVLGNNLTWNQGRYPDSLGGSALPWIVCGTDDPSIRPSCQQLWPERLLVTATEDVFGYVAWHGLETADSFCAACQPAPPFTSREPIPTAAPASVAIGVAAASLFGQLAAGLEPPHRTDLLTLRLDAPLAIEYSDPIAAPDCSVCTSRPIVFTRRQDSRR